MNWTSSGDAAFAPWAWAAFLAFVLAMLALDLGVFHRRSRTVSLREAAIWSAVWVALALCFNAVVFFVAGTERGLEFTAGYLIEKALSVDNIFIFVVIFAAFGIPAAHQHRVLFWGILCALIMRAGFIFAGGALLERFHWMIWVFGGLLIVTGLKLLIQREQGYDPERNPLVRLTRRVMPVGRLDGDRFFSVQGGRRVATPLLLALLAVEFTDVIFALDSIPAIFAVTRDPFIVFTSNVFAILGLRSLFFLLAGVIDRFHLLKIGLALVLIFVGLKMALVEIVAVPVWLSLLVIAGLIGGSIFLSLSRPPTRLADERSGS